VVLLVTVVGALYAGLVVLAFSIKPKLTFVPLKQLLLTHTHSSLEQKASEPDDVFVVNSSGQKLHGWYYDYEQRTGSMSMTVSSSEPSPDSRVALVCHGNGANLSYYPVLVSLFASLGMSVLIFDYPGYGRSEGKPTEANVYESALLFFDQLLSFGFSKNQVVVAGMSLGGAVATRVARERPGCGALVLISTFVSPRQLLRTLFWPLMAVGFVANEFFLNEDLKIVTALQPALRTVVLHSRTDGLIDFSHAETNAKTASARLLEIDGWHGDPRFSDATIAELGTLLQKSK